MCVYAVWQNILQNGGILLNCAHSLEFKAFIEITGDVLGICVKSCSRPSLFLMFGATFCLIWRYLDFLGEIISHNYTKIESPVSVKCV